MAPASAPIRADFRLQLEEPLDARRDGQNPSRRRPANPSATWPTGGPETQCRWLPPVPAPNAAIPRVIDISRTRTSLLGLLDRRNLRIVVRRGLVLGFEAEGLLQQSARFAAGAAKK